MGLPEPRAGCGEDEMCTPQQGNQEAAAWVPPPPGPCLSSGPQLVLPSQHFLAVYIVIPGSAFPQPHSLPAPICTPTTISAPRPPGPSYPSTQITQVPRLPLPPAASASSSASSKQTGGPQGGGGGGRGSCPGQGRTGSHPSLSGCQRKPDMR